MRPTEGSLKLVGLEAARRWLRDGDLLLFRRRSLVAIGGRGVHSHAAKVAWWDEEPFCLEIRGLAGGRAVTLASQVRRYPGRIDVFAANPDNRWPQYDRRGAVRVMRRFCGCRYGYRAVIRAALVHLPLLRLWAPADLDDGASSAEPPFCSQACVIADRLGGRVDPVPQLADRLTEPADLARSPFYRYRFTLNPS